MVAKLQKGEKNYMNLFDVLEMTHVFDEALQQKLVQLFPGSSIEPARKHLYHVLIKSLRQYEGDSEIETRLMTLLQDSRILYNKGLYALSMEQLNRAKHLAFQHEKFIHYILAARQELQCLVRSQFAGISEDELVEKQEKIKNLLEHESSSSQHAMLYQIVLFRYWKSGIVRNQDDIAKLNDVLLEEYQILNSQRFQSFESQQLHLHFQSIYFTMTGNPLGSLTVFRDLDGLFQRHDHLWRNAPLYYVHLLGGILYDLRLMERYDEMPHFIERLRSIPQTSQGLSIVIKYLIFENLLNASVDQKQASEAMRLIEKYKPEFERETAQLPLQTRLQLQFAISRAWFFTGDHSKALKLINSILNQPSGSVYQPLHVVCRLLNLQINALLKNTEYLFYALRSIERKLKAERKLFGVEKLILSFLKRWIALKPIKNEKKQLVEISKNPFEHQLMKELNLSEWIEQVKSIKLV